MSRLIICLLAMVAWLAMPPAFAAEGSARTAPANPVIDSATYLRDAQAAMAHRESRRLSEDEFIALAAKPGVVILDGRTKGKYNALRVRGAVNLSFPDITVEALARIVPTHATTILIYCNNNFANAPDSMPLKLPPAALNLAMYTSLYTYGYRNVYELGPNLDVNATRIALVR